MEKINTMYYQAKHDGCLHTSSKRSSHAHVNRVPIVVSLSCVCRSPPLDVDLH
jgi:hypothetical protein